MYKYLCVVSDSADENSFRDTIQKIKGFYPHFEYAEQFMNGSLEKMIVIPDERGVPSHICIRMDQQNSKTVVISESYLHHIFSGRTVENISECSKLTFHLLSAAFLIVNIAAVRRFSELIFLYFLLPWLALINIVPLIAVYGISAWGIKKITNLPSSKILFMEAGGYLIFPFLAVIFIWGMITNSLNSIPIFFLGIRYVCLLLPSAAIGTAIAEKLTKK